MFFHKERLDVGTETGTQGGEHNVETEAEIGGYVYKTRNTEDCWQPLEVRKKQEPSEGA